MNNITGKLILISPQKINNSGCKELNFIPEDTDYIQDHKTFEHRRKHLIDEFEKELNKFRNNSMKLI